MYPRPSHEAYLIYFFFVGFISSYNGDTASGYGKGGGYYDSAFYDWDGGVAVMQNKATQHVYVIIFKYNTATQIVCTPALYTNFIRQYTCLLRTSFQFTVVCLHSNTAASVMLAVKDSCISVCTVKYSCISVLAVKYSCISVLAFKYSCISVLAVKDSCISVLAFKYSQYRPI